MAVCSVLGVLTRGTVIASAGTGIGAALIGGGSGSILDRMIERKSSEGTVALVNNIGKFIMANGAGAGADDDRLLNLIGSIGPRASEAISLIQSDFAHSESRSVP